MVEKDHFGTLFAPYKQGDLHVHTNFSHHGITFDGNSSPEQLVERAEELGLDFIAITDHDTFVPSYIAREYASNHSKVEVITGAEISSKDGHILALGIEHNIPYWLSAEDTIRAIHADNGLAIPAHPFFKLTSSLGAKKLRELADSDDPEVYLDGIEVFNAGANDWRWAEWFKLNDGNRKARRVYKKDTTGKLGAAVAGSDAHNEGVGRGVTVIPADMDVFTAIKTKLTGVVMTDEKEGNTLKTIVTTWFRSHDLEKRRVQFAPSGQIFPSLADSSVNI